MLNTVVLPIETEYISRPSSIMNFQLEENEDLYLFRLISFFVSKGIKTVQVIDESENLKLVNFVKTKFPNLCVIGGGNIDTIKRAGEFIKNGANYIIIGRHFVTNPHEAIRFNAKFSGKVIYSIDDKNQSIEYNKRVNSIDFAIKMAGLGINHFVYVNCEKRLSNKGILLNTFMLLKKMIKNKTFLYSGGVSTLADVKQVKLAGADGIIIGTALYKKNLDCKTVLLVFRNN